MLKVEMTDKVKAGTFRKRDGSVVAFRDQEAYVVLPGKKFPVEFRVRLDEGQPAYPAGVFQISTQSFEVGQFGDLRLGTLVLEQIAAKG